MTSPTRRLGPPATLQRSTLLRSTVVLSTLLLSACAGPSGLRGTPVSSPAGRPGWLTYRVGALSFEAPSGWEAGGDARRVALVPPGGAVRLEARELGRHGADEAACLADGEAALQARDAGLARVQRHPSALAGKKAITQEADQGGDHGWAWVTCAGPLQHWLTFTGRTPIGQAHLEAWRAVVQSARVGGGA
jgi:hypothetical protein